MEGFFAFVYFLLFLGALYVSWASSRKPKKSTSYIWCFIAGLWISASIVQLAKALS